MYAAPFVARLGVGHPYPNDLTLATTDPHHKHIPPDIKHHRVSAPHLSFTRPNLPVLIQEVEQLA